jgi:hypothetical protein
MKDLQFSTEKMIRGIQNEKELLQKQLLDVEKELVAMENRYKNVNSNQVSNSSSFKASPRSDISGIPSQVNDRVSPGPEIHHSLMFQTPNQRQRSIPHQQFVNTIDLEENKGGSMNGSLTPIDEDLSMETTKKELMGTHTVFVQMWNLIK